MASGYDREKNDMQELSVNSKTLIQESWQKLAPNIYGMAVSFYKELYSLDSSLVPDYDAIDIKKQAEKALMTLSFLTSILDSLADSKKRIKKLVEGHIQDHEGIGPNDFTLVKRAVLVAMGHTLRANWSKEHAIAWHQLILIVEELWVEKDLPKQSYDFPVFKV